MTVVLLKLNSIFVGSVLLKVSHKGEILVIAATSKREVHKSEMLLVEDLDII